MTKIKLIAGLISTLFIAACSPTEKHQELTQNQKIIDAPQVIEFFGYYCPACYSVEANLSEWKKSNSHIQVEQIPYSGGVHKKHERMVKAYYISEELGIKDKLHNRLFNYHIDENKYFASNEDVRDFFTEFGITPQQYEKADKSLNVLMKVNRAKKLSEKVGIQRIPSFVINGEWLTDPSMHKDFGNKLFSEITTLLEKDTSLAMDEKKSCDKFTLSDFSEHVDRLHSISMFLDSGAYTDDIRPGLTEHLLNEIESLQGVLMHAKAFGFDS